MRLNNLAPAAGARKEGRRLGRGTGSGLGKTSGKGHKGQWARSGGGVKPGFEGGQTKLAVKIPKRGFTANFKKIYSIVNVCDLDAFDNGTEITMELLLDKGVIRKAEPYGLKVLGNGELTKKITVKAQKFTKAAQEAIEKAGGKAEVI